MVLAERVPEFFGPAPATDVVAHARQDMEAKLDAMQDAVADKAWLAGDFSIADIAMVEVFRVVAAEDALGGFPALEAYVARAEARPAFQKAMKDHMRHWEMADAVQAKQNSA
jgi:glutathione S-transferase